MKYCKKCVQPDTRPRIYFNEDGVCGACLWKEEKKTIDWEARRQELQGIADWAKKEAKKRGTYDCVLGVSGGKDTTFTSLYARDRLGLNCLLVNAWPEQMTEIGRYNIENLCKLGFDIINIKTNPRVMRKIIRDDFFKRGNLNISTEYTIWSSAYRVAMEHKVPLIIQGENEALTLGASEGQTRDGEATQVYKNNTLSGVNAFQRYADCEGVSRKDLFLYNFPDPGLLDRIGIRAYYLEFYINEWDQVGNAEFSIKHGLKIREDDLSELGSVQKFCALDSDLWLVNQLIKYYKLGFGYATDEACYEIREGRITREEGFELVRKYDGKCGEKYIKKACDYIGITTDIFWREIEKWRGPMWRRDSGGSWTLKND
ncbi:MAG: N-acetyl sugar amidotransferase [Nitrospirae bacterium]|nr:MAG: N-acetyl sugar amidotransferase [Nitrospirota bacterium]